MQQNIIQSTCINSNLEQPCSVVEVTHPHSAYLSLTFISIIGNLAV